MGHAVAVLFQLVISAAIGALIGALLVRIACSLVAKFTPPFGMAYKAAFLGYLASVAAGVVVGLVLGLSTRRMSTARLVGFLVLGILVQAAVYSRVLRHPKTGRLGFAKASLVSLLQGVIAVSIFWVVLAVAGAILG